MNRRVVLVSYLILVASAVILLIPPLIAPYSYYPYFYGSILGFPTPILSILAVAGLIVGPYFGLAGLIVKDKSFWVEAGRMLQAHISFPIIGAVVLYYGSLVPLAFATFLLPAYISFVFIATLITVMGVRASRRSAAAGSVSVSSSV